MKERLTNDILALTTGDLTHQGPIQSQTIVQEENEFTVIMSNPSKSFCVGIVDIVNSTRTVANLTQNKASMYYEIYLNHMAKIISKCNGTVLKTMGDSLLFYFPDSCHSERKYGFLSCLECSCMMVDEHENLTQILQKERLPEIDYRISADYGSVTIMKSKQLSVDLVGTTINTCAKINDQAPVNGIIIGGDLYEKTKRFGEFHFKEIQSFSTGLKQSYPIFIVYRKN